MTQTDFDRETSVERTHEEGAASIWRGAVHQNWNIGDNPNGGYMVSIALAAITQVIEHPHPLTVTTHFLRPGSPDTACEVHVEVLRSGRMLSTVRATLSQAGKARIEVLAAFGNLSESVGVETELTLPAPQHAPPEACVPRSGEAQGIHLPITERLHVQLDPQCARAGENKEARVSGWIRFADQREPDAIALPLFADAFPPSAFAKLGVVGWVPTLELTVHIRRLPTPGWILGRFETQDLSGGRMLENGWLWDSAGNLVAQSRQIGLVMKGDN